MNATNATHFTVSIRTAATRQLARSLVAILAVLVWGGIAVADSHYADSLESGTADQLLRRYAPTTGSEMAGQYRVISAEPISGFSTPVVTPRATVAVAPPRNARAAQRATIVTNPAHSTGVQPAIYTRQTLVPVTAAIDHRIVVVGDRDGTSRYRRDADRFRYDHRRYDRDGRIDRYRYRYDDRYRPYRYDRYPYSYRYFTPRAYPYYYPYRYHTYPRYSSPYFRYYYQDPYRGSYFHYYYRGSSFHHHHKRYPQSGLHIGLHFRF